MNKKKGKQLVNFKLLKNTNTLISVSSGIQLFQLRLFPSKAEKSKPGAKGLLEIAKKLMNLLTIPSKHFALVFDFSAFPLCSGQP
jgi:hypothetical protein